MNRPQGGPDRTGSRTEEKGRRTGNSGREGEITYLLGLGTLGKGFPEVGQLSWALKGE